MTELELHKFITENSIEYHQYDNDGVLDVMIMPSFGELYELNKIISKCFYDDGGIEIIMKDGYVCIWMKDLCEYHGIEMYNIFENYAES